MNLIISLIAAEIFLLLCAKPLKKNPGPFYGAAALASALCTGLYWSAPAGISPALLAKLPLWLGALGTACFIEVMAVGAMPNGHAKIKQVMPVRGELSIFACLLTLGQNLSYGKNYFAPGFLCSGPVTAVKAAAWISLVMIALMLVLTATSVKAVRRRFAPKRWKALQRWAYLFYGLIYVHVLLMSVPAFLKGRGGYGLTLLAYSVVFLSYAICRIRKAVLLHRGQAVKAAGQLAAVGFGVALSLALTAGLYRSIPASPAIPQTPDSLSQNADKPEDEPVGTDSPEVRDALGEDAQDGQEAPKENAPDAGEEALQPEDEPQPEGKPEPEDSAEPEAAELQEEIHGASSEPDALPEAEPEGDGAEPQTAPEEEPEQEEQEELETATEPEPASKYRDGTYTGSGEGYYGPVTVSVTISGDVITSISVDSFIDDDDYFGDARDGVIPAIVSAQSPDVSAVSGATYSSKGIMAAVRDALAQAENK